MKQYVLLLMLFFCLDVSAQVDTIPFPPGYTPGQLSQKSILRVAPDDHVWVGFSHRGLGEYDGTNWRMYTDTNGLPSNYVSALAFDGNVKWIGTFDGLIKTDGVNLLLFDTFSTPLPSNRINDLYVSDTALWIATDSGAVCFDGANWNFYNTLNSPLTSNNVLCINENSFGIYISTDNGISILTSNGWKTTSPAIPLTYRFTKDKNGNLYSFNYQIHDTVFHKIVISTNPCEYNSLNTQIAFYLGATTNNKIFSITQYLPQYTIVLESDSSENIKNSYLNQYAFPLPSMADTFELFDFNNLGELLSTGEFKKIYKINFPGVNALPQTDSCPYLDINQVQARVWNFGSMFWDLTGNPLYEVPKGSGKSPIFSEGLWLGGKDPQGKLHIAAQTYRQGGNDFWPGPLDTTNATIDPATFHQYDKLWKIDRYTILDFISHFQNGSVTNGTFPIPDIILNWPAHGTGNISRSLAPFIDYNLDGIYNPYDGDYPDIKGDQMLWWVMNDNYASHGETGSLYNLGVEIHGSAYAYTCPNIVGGDSVINYTTFYHYDFFNRSDTSYHDVYSGIYTDIDLGNFIDDYVGCDTALDIAFGLNGDDNDEAATYTIGYGLHPPMINLALLKGPDPSPNDGLDNNHNGIIDEPGENCMMNYFIYSSNDGTAIGNPSTAQDHYNRLHGIWKDSLLLTYGGTGHNPSSTNYTNYMFSGPPYDTTGWSEYHPCPGCSSNPPGDRRFTVSSGPFDLPAHQQRSLDYAYVYTREPNFPNGTNTSLAVNHDQVMRIKHFFETDSFPCKHLIGIDEIKKEDLQVNLYPNPAHSEIFVTLAKTEPGIKTFYMTDIPGQIISNPSKISASSFRIDLSKLKPGIYFLHIMTNEKSCVRKFIVE